MSGNRYLFHYSECLKFAKVDFSNKSYKYRIMKHFKKIQQYLFLLGIALLLAACDKKDYKLVSSYVGIDNMNVFVFSTTESDMEKLKSFAQEQPHEDGATTAVFFYNQIDPITRSVDNAPTFEEAIEKGCTKKCIAGYWKYASGMDKIVANPLNY